MNTDVTFINALLLRVPELKALYEEHLGDNEELLPHVFMWDVTRFAIAQADNVQTHEPLRRLLAVLEEALEGGADKVNELIAVSFAENLIGEEAALKVLKPLMGPRLSREVQNMCG
jgi:hypothetical protein